MNRKCYHSPSPNTSKSYRALFLALATIDDPLKKREQFAVSLRKEKSKNLVKSKRMKLMQQVVAQTPNSNSLSTFKGSSQQECLDQANLAYYGYYKFTE